MCMKGEDGFDQEYYYNVLYTQVSDIDLPILSWHRE